jgi:hypothetical protein
VQPDVSLYIKPWTWWLDNCEKLLVAIMWVHYSPIGFVSFCLFCLSYIMWCEYGNIGVKLCTGHWSLEPQLLYDFLIFIWWTEEAPLRAYYEVPLLTVNIIGPSPICIKNWLGSAQDHWSIIIYIRHVSELVSLSWLMSEYQLIVNNLWCFQYHGEVGWNPKNYNGICEKILAKSQTVVCRRTLELLCYNLLYLLQYTVFSVH